MDELEMYEILTLEKLIPWSSKQRDEQTRILLWANLFGKAKHLKSYDKLWPLETDKNKLYQDHERTLDAEEADKIREEIKRLWRKNYQ